MTEKDVPVHPTRTSSRLRGWTAALVAATLALGGALVTAPSTASAAPGDVAAATLDWGVKTSFRSYLTGPIAHGIVTATGVSTTTPYGWSNGTGTATGTVAYPGTLQFQGHQGMNVEPDQYALDLTFSDLKVKLTGASTAELILDAHSRGLADPANFIGLDDVVFATLDLAGGTNGSTDEIVAYSGVPATLTADGATAFGGFYSAGQALDPVSFSWPVEQEEEEPPTAPSTPTLTVSKTAGLYPNGETVTISGAGYNPAQPIYVIVCRDVPLSEVDFTFAGPCTVGAKAIYASTETNPDRTKFTAAGSFTTTMSVSKNISFATGSAIYTLANHTAMNDRTQDAKQTISFTPLLAVSKATGLDPSGETVTVNGYGYNPAQPIYLIVCRDVPLSEVSFAFAGPCTPGSKAIYASTETNPDRTKFAADGSFSTTFTVANSSALASGAALYTLANHLAPTDRTQDAKRAISFVTGTPTATALTSSAASVLAGGSVTLTASVTPATEGSVTFYNGTESLGTVTVLTGVAQQAVSNLQVGTAGFRAMFTPTKPWLFASSEGSVNVTVTSPVAATGSLTWGVKSSFRDYITGNIAKGTITTSGISTSGGAFVFPQSANGLNESGTGTASYSGSVRFYGHAGELDLTFSNPVVRVSSASSGTLSAASGGSTVAIASLNLGAGIRSTANGTVSYSAVPATLTAAGATAFAGFYPAGTALDPVSFVAGSNGSTTAGTTTTAAFVGAKVPPNAPPATTGVTLADGIELEEGGEITITADGFRPNENGIMVVIYSSPIVLARDLVADANGVVTWTGRLPAGLTGEHTLTVQGSVDRGIVLNIPTAEAAVVEGCPVDDATIVWGFKESFRSYVSGSIANGEWTVSDGATYETPNFGWSNGTGGYDTDTAKGLLAFTGSIAFTGHSGVLNTVVANPQVEFVDRDTAYLLLDVSGTTQDGEAVEQKAVRFVELSLAEGQDGEGQDTEKGDAVSFTAVPTVLTDEGAAAFGTYEAGSDFDPITVSFTTAGCTELAAEATPVTAAPMNSGQSLAWIWWVVGALVLAAIVAVVIVLVTRRRATA